MLSFYVNIPPHIFFSWSLRALTKNRLDFIESLRHNVLNRKHFEALTNIRVSIFFTFLNILSFDEIDVSNITLNQTYNN